MSAMSARPQTLCATCDFAKVCALSGYGTAELSELQYLVERVGPFRRGAHLFRTGDPFRALFAVSYGSVKTTTVDRNGREQVTGFHLPGDTVGLRAIDPGRYTCDAIALEPTECCRFGFRALSELATRQPQIQRHLFAVLSAQLGARSLALRDHNVDERVAAFLIDLGDRYASRGLSATRFRLSMARGDIANYLHVAAETISRVLRRFCDRNLIAVGGHDVELIDTLQLRALAGGVLKAN